MASSLTTLQFNKVLVYITITIIAITIVICFVLFLNRQNKNKIKIGRHLDHSNSNDEYNETESSHLISSDEYGAISYDNSDNPFASPA